MAMKFLNKLYVKAIFSDAPELNLSAYDMGENMISISYEDDVVNRMKTATGSMGSLAIFVSATATVSIVKSSPAIDAYKSRILTNGFIGGTLTIYDDINGEWVLEDISLNQKEIGSVNGTEPAIEFQIQGNLLVNKESLYAFNQGSKTLDFCA